MQLSPHFTLDELTVSQTAARKGIDNTPSNEIVSALQRTAMGLEQVRLTLGGAPLLISSGYRSPALNSAIGGARNSQHMLGEAADFTAPRFGSVQDVFEEVKRSGIQFDQLIIEYGRWVHISFSDKPRAQALVIDDNGTRAA